MSATVAKPCAGIVNQLAPVRMADLMSASGGTSAPAAPKTGYVPPHARKAEPVKPKEITLADMKSDELFPTLGVAPKAGGGASWGALRAKLAAPAAPAPVQTQNQFAALDEDAVEAAATPSPAPANFKEVIQERIRKDEEEATIGADPIYDPEKDGYTVLKLPTTEAERAAFLRAFSERLKPDVDPLEELRESTPEDEEKWARLMRGETDYKRPVDPTAAEALTDYWASQSKRNSIPEFVAPPGVTGAKLSKMRLMHRLRYSSGGAKQSLVRAGDPSALKAAMMAQPTIKKVVLRPAEPDLDYEEPDEEDYDSE